MKFKKVFTKNNPYSKITFVEKTSKIMNLNGGTVKEFGPIWVPDTWSQTAVDILAQKYARKAKIPQFTTKIAEDGVPVWLQKSTPDHEKLKTLPESERYTFENDSRQIFNRLAGTWTYWGWKGNYFATENDAKNFYDELCYMLCSQRVAPNSPQWFNTGLHWAYGIEGEPQGHYFFDETINEISKSSSAYERPQPHACFIQSIADDLLQEGGIVDLVARETRVFKYGSGSGTNFSSLRGRSEKLSSGGISSGLLSFLKVLDSNAGAIKSGGTTRRSAKMVIVDIDHPDIIEYVRWKSKEEDKVVFLSVGSKIVKNAIDNVKNACLSWTGPKSQKCDPEFNEQLAEALHDAENNQIPYGYLDRIIKLLEQDVDDIDCEILTTEFESEAYSSVSGQNSNNSVRVGNNFMEKVLTGGNVDLTFRTTGAVAETIPANQLWHEISKSAWLCADPGIQYDTTINDWHTCKNSGRINGSNPCSEYMFLDDTACNLASINLLKFYDHNNGDWKFKEDEFAHAVQIWTTVLEISIAMAQFPSKLIAQRSFEFRTLGLGYANLGALLMQSGIPYDSEEGRALAAYITALMHGEAYNTSAKLADRVGPFAKFAENKQSMLEVIQNHKTAVLGGNFINIGIKPLILNWNQCPIKSKTRLEKLWNEVVANGEKYGFRNAQVTLLAPTGTIGLLMDCDTLGIEPDFSLIKHKKLSGGGYFKIINNSIKPALQSLKYSKSEIEDIINYVVGHGTLENATGKLNNNFLKQHGFTDEQLNKVNATLKNSFDVGSALSKWVLGEEVFNKLNCADSNELFEKLGVSDEDQQHASQFACGNGSMVGAPHIKDKHLAIFDCATNNDRFISTYGHIKMVASVQPFLSGAVSKTINMPENSTIKECGDAYMFAWDIGTKAIALYRDGSKLAQALNLTNNKKTSYKKSDSDEIANVQVSDANSIVSNDIDSADDNTLGRGVQEPLPSRRKGYTQKVKIAGHTFYHTTGENNDGELRELFTSGMGTEGATFRSLMNCFSKILSISLQHGVPLKKLVDALLFTKFDPSGPISGHDSIKFSTSIADYLARDLAIRYLGMTELGHVNPDDNADVQRIVTEQNKNTASHQKSTVDHTNSKKHNSTKFGYTGDMCQHCKQFTMKRVGTCLQCESCGSTTGCS